MRLEDVAAFWKAFVQELRFLWEEGNALVPRMVGVVPLSFRCLARPLLLTSPLFFFSFF